MNRFLLALLLLGALCASCESVEWYDKPPQLLHGVWVEHPPDSIGSFETADTVRVRPNAVILSEFDSELAVHRTVCRPIRRVSRHDRKYIVFCGKENDDHIAEARIQLWVAGDSLQYASIQEVMARGINDLDGYFDVGEGQFVKTE